MADGVIADHRLSHVSTASSTNSKRAKAHIGPWQLGRTLGRGSSGRVRLAKHTETGKLAAVKIVPKSQISDSNTSNTKNSEMFGIEREVIIMKLIEHPNIMTLYDVWENKGELYLVLEYIEGGELFDYLISRGRLSEREAIHYFRQICYGVDYCHKFNICHRDLKPENLLLDKHRNIKIADFGMAALESNGRLLETSCGSPHYASPEIVTGKTYHGAPSDIWSCGIILFALLTGHLPFDDDNIRQLLLKVQAGKFQMPSSLSVEARDLISRMLVVNPTRRITMKQIFAHPLLTKYPIRRAPAENSDKKTPKIDVTQPIMRIDPEILRNLQTLWHHDSREYLIKRLRQPEPNTEKTFYSLLLRFRQRHGLTSRDSLPRNRSVASIRSLRSSKSVRSIASLNSKTGSMKSLRSIRSNRSGRSLLNRRVPRHSPVKSLNKGRKPDEAPVKPLNIKPLNIKKHNDNTDVFAQLLDQAFNSPVSTPTSAVSDQSTLNQSSLHQSTLNDYTTTAEAAYPAPVSKSYLPDEKRSSGDSSSTAYTFNFDLPPVSTNYELNAEPPADAANNYLLPMIFEEDRFADAIEEDLDNKLYKRYSRIQPATNARGEAKSEPRGPYTLASKPLTNDGYPSSRRNHMLRANGAGGTGNNSMSPPITPITPTSAIDNSQLQIHNLVAGESFLSYKPSPAAASIPGPNRPAPRAPSGPREMAAPRKAVPIYVESESDSSNADESTISGRKPLAPITSHQKPLQRNSQAPITVAKRGTKPPTEQPEEKDKEKRSWIRRLTPRIVSRKSSKPEPESAKTKTKPDNYRASANKENEFVDGSKAYNRETRQPSTEEPRQNWFMKFLSSSSPQAPSKTLYSGCQPIELRAIVLEVLSEWMPHGLALYTDGARGEPINVGIMRQNSLKLKPARIGISIQPTRSGTSMAQLEHASGSRTSFFTFAGELERRLAVSNFLG